MKRLIALSLTIIFLLLAYWLGEAGKGIFEIAPYLGGLIGIATIAYPISRKWKKRTIISFIFIIIYAAAFYLGDHSFYRAYNTCIDDSQQIRAALTDFKLKNGKYPVVLDELDIPIPCKRYLRGTILEYESMPSNYKIWFKDRFVEHSATDKEPFMAHK